MSSNTVMKITLNGIDVFKTKASELVSILECINGPDFIKEGNGYSYSFPKISVGLWRELTPKDYLELVAATKADGMYEEMKEDLAADYIKSEYFQIFNVASADYFGR